MAESTLIKVREANLEIAAAVHILIPEFDPEYIKDFYEEKAAKNSPYIIVGYVNERPAGYMIAFNRSDALYMWLTGVIPEYRRSHLFTMMNEELEHEAVRRGKNQITVKTGEQYPSMLKALAKQGFNEVMEKTEKTIRLRKMLS